MTSYSSEKVGEKEKDLTRSDSIVDEKNSFMREADGTSIVEGSEGVTEYELATLRHVPDRLPYTSWLVVVVEFAERCVAYSDSHPERLFSKITYRWTYYGTTNIYNNYIQFPLPPGSKDGSVPRPLRGGDTVAGALGRGQQKSFALRAFSNYFGHLKLGSPADDILLGTVRHTIYSTARPNDSYLDEQFLGLCYSLRWRNNCGHPLGAIQHHHGVFYCLLVRIFSSSFFVFFFFGGSLPTRRIGHIILVTSAAPSVLAQENTSLALLVVSIIVMVSTFAPSETCGSFISNTSYRVSVLGRLTYFFLPYVYAHQRVFRAIKANVSPLIAEQYTGKLRKGPFLYLSSWVDKFLLSFCRNFTIRRGRYQISCNYHSAHVLMYVDPFSHIVVVIDE